MEIVEIKNAVKKLFLDRTIPHDAKAQFLKDLMTKQDEFPFLDTLQRSQGTCGKPFDGVCFSCETCGFDDSSAVCEDCFEPEKHVGHKVTHSDVPGMCDCGDLEAWNCKGACVHHQDPFNMSLPDLSDDIYSHVKNVMRELLHMMEAFLVENILQKLCERVNIDETNETEKLSCLLVAPDEHHNVRELSSLFMEILQKEKWEADEMVGIGDKLAISIQDGSILEKRNRFLAGDVLAIATTIGYTERLEEFTGLCIFMKEFGAFHPLPRLITELMTEGPTIPIKDGRFDLNEEIVKDYPFLGCFDQNKRICIPEGEIKKTLPFDIMSASIREEHQDHHEQEPLEQNEQQQQQQQQQQEDHQNNAEQQEDQGLVLTCPIFGEPTEVPHPDQFGDVDVIRMDSGDHVDEDGVLTTTADISHVNVNGAEHDIDQHQQHQHLFGEFNPNRERIQDDNNGEEEEEEEEDDAEEKRIYQRPSTQPYAIGNLPPINRLQGIFNQVIKFIETVENNDVKPVECMKDVEVGVNKKDGNEYFYSICDFPLRPRSMKEHIDERYFHKMDDSVSNYDTPIGHSIAGRLLWLGHFAMGLPGVSFEQLLLQVITHPVLRMRLTYEYMLLFPAMISIQAHGFLSEKSQLGEMLCQALTTVSVMTEVQEVFPIMEMALASANRVLRLNEDTPSYKRVEDSVTMNCLWGLVFPNIICDSEATGQMLIAKRNDLLQRMCVVLDSITGFERTVRRDQSQPHVEKDEYKWSAANRMVHTVMVLFVHMLDKLFNGHDETMEPQESKECLESILAILKTFTLTHYGRKDVTMLNMVERFVMMIFDRMSSFMSLYNDFEDETFGKDIQKLAIDISKIIQPGIIENTSVMAQILGNAWIRNGEGMIMALAHNMLPFNFTFLMDSFGLAFLTHCHEMECKLSNDDDDNNKTTPASLEEAPIQVLFKEAFCENNEKRGGIELFLFNICVQALTCPQLSLCSPIRLIESQIVHILLQQPAIFEEIMDTISTPYIFDEGFGGMGDKTDEMVSMVELVLEQVATLKKLGGFGGEVYNLKKGGMLYHPTRLWYTREDHNTAKESLIQSHKELYKSKDGLRIMPEPLEFFGPNSVKKSLLDAMCNDFMLERIAAGIKEFVEMESTDKDQDEKIDEDCVRSYICMLTAAYCKIGEYCRKSTTPNEKEMDSQLDNMELIDEKLNDNNVDDDDDDEEVEIEAITMDNIEIRNLHEKDDDENKEKRDAGNNDDSDDSNNGEVDTTLFNELMEEFADRLKKYNIPSLLSKLVNASDTKKCDLDVQAGALWFLIVVQLDNGLQRSATDVHKKDEMSNVLKSKQSEMMEKLNNKANDFEEWMNDMEDELGESADENEEASNETSQNEKDSESSKNENKNAINDNDDDDNDDDEVCIFCHEQNDQPIAHLTDLECSYHNAMATSQDAFKKERVFYFKGCGHVAHIGCIKRFDIQKMEQLGRDVDLALETSSLYEYSTTLCPMCKTLCGFAIPVPPKNSGFIQFDKESSLNEILSTELPMKASNLDLQQLYSTEANAGFISFATKSLEFVDGRGCDPLEKIIDMLESELTTTFGIPLMTEKMEGELSIPRQTGKMWIHLADCLRTGLQVLCGANAYWQVSLVGSYKKARHIMLAALNIPFVTRLAAALMCSFNEKCARECLEDVLASQIVRVVAATSPEVKTTDDLVFAIQESMKLENANSMPFPTTLEPGSESALLLQHQFFMLLTVMNGMGFVSSEVLQTELDNSSTNGLIPSILACLAQDVANMNVFGALERFFKQDRRYYQIGEPILANSLGEAKPMEFAAKLPPQNDAFSLAFAKHRCDTTGKPWSRVAICLKCGECICHGCPDCIHNPNTKAGPATRHAEQCNSGQCIFINEDETLLVHRAYAAFLPTIYSELIGKSVFKLSKERLQILKNLMLSGGIAEVVLKTRMDLDIEERVVGGLA